MPMPIILVAACSKELDDQPYHAVQSKYIDALLKAAGCQPLILPALGAQAELSALLAVADGVLLPGSTSNIDPSHYGQALHDPASPQDTARDATTLPLAREALARGIPLLAICRGFQEVNVALGGSLHQALHNQPGMADHREPEQAPLQQRYAPAHRITLTPHGRLSRILDGARETMVNSLHGQGLHRLAPGLRVEALADDGLVEAYSVVGAPGFALATQWHPEWRALENPDSLRLFRAFGDACREFRRRRAEQAEPTTA